MTLAAARKVPRIGAVTATPADLYLHKEKFHRVPYGNNGELMQAIQSREIDAALIWSPAFGALRSPDQGRQPVIAKEQSPDRMLRTNLLIAVGTAQTALAQEVNGALEQMRADGSIRSTAEAQGLPWLAP
jgi:ABC-type amino acid transport substrate-binding protein